MVESVTSSENYNWVHIWVSAVGACKSEHDSYIGEDRQEHDYYYSTKDVELSAKIDEDAHDTTKLNVDEAENSISPDINDGDFGGDKTGIHLRNATYFAADEMIGIIPYIGTGYDIAKFAYEEFGPGGSEKLDDSASGPGEEAGQTFERLGDSASGLDSKDLYAVGTHFTYKFDNNYLPDQFDMTISAKNIMGHYYDGSKIQTKDGAEASVDITLKNAKPSVTQGLDTDKYYYEASDYSDAVHPDLEDLTVENPAGATEPTYEVEIQANPSWESDGWETIAYSYISHGVAIDDHMNIVHIPDDGTYHTVELRVNSIRAYDKYGGWTIGPRDSIKIEVKNYGSEDGGGCPYVSPYNGTKFKRDNNILVQSEFRDGEVTDYYKLDNHLAEHNGNYSLKIEEFENSEDYLNQMKLYTIDHKEGYKVGVTPDGEYLTYKNSDAPNSAYTAKGTDVLKEVKDKDDGKRLEMEAGSEITLDYGDRSFTDWKHSKLVLRSSGSSSYTDKSDDFSTMAWKTSLYVKLRADKSDWYNVTCTHPRNNPHDHVIPLEDTIHEMMKDGHTLDDMEVKIRSTKKHNIDYVGLDDSAPTPVKVQEADLLEVMKTDFEGKTIEKTGSLKHDDSDVVNLVPGEECTVTFDALDQFPGKVFEERDFIIETTGWYEKYE